jgi:hypothetical protein
MSPIESAKFLRKTIAANKVAKEKAKTYLTAVLNRQPNELEIRHQMMCDIYKVKLVKGKITT